MGMFDWFTPNGDPRFVCSEGHPIREMQTKDFDCMLDIIDIVDGRLHASGRRGSGPMSDSTTADIYGECEMCPTFIRCGTHRGESFMQRFDMQCDFNVVLVGGVIQSVTRTSKSLADWIIEMKAHPTGMVGPLSPAEASRRMNEAAAMSRARRKAD